MRILTAFTSSLGGRDAYHLGVVLAEALACPLDLVTVVRGGEEAATRDVTDAPFQDVVVAQISEWMNQVIAERPPPGPLHRYVRSSPSFPEGILDSAEELGTSVLVAGGGRHGVLGRVALGSVGQALLNASPVPVALAPRGMRDLPAAPLTRMTVMLGETTPWAGLLRPALALADRAGVPVRLVTVCASGPVDDPVTCERVDSMLTAARAEVPGLEDRPVDRVHAESVSRAVHVMDWDRHEVALLGSARLAQPGRLFLGPSANKILRVLPVPMIAVPAPVREAPS